MPNKRKLRLDQIKVNSFVTTPEESDKIHGGTGNCLSFINITCPEPCDFHSIGDYSCPIDGGCNSGRCAEATVETYCGSCWPCNWI